MQETKTLTLPTSKKTVIIKGYMSRRIDDEVRAIRLGANKTSYDVSPEEVAASQKTGIDPSPTVHIESDPTVAVKADNKLLELMVVSVGGVATNVLNTLLDLPADDVQYILDQINGVEADSKVVSADPKAPTT